MADIHFDYRLALIAIESGIDKVRINPGNIGSIEKVKAVVDACKEKHIPIRIGVNGGSLENEILEDLDFHDIVISLKSSNTMLTIKAYELASKTFPYPLHVGVTEAGTALGGTIKSALGIGTLLYEGIGNTIRVSLSDDPVEEIKVAKILLKELGLLKGVPTLVSCPTCGRIQYDLIPIAKEMEDFLKDIHLDITVAIMGCAVNGPGEARHADIGIAGGVFEDISDLTDDEHLVLKALSKTVLKSISEIVPSTPFGKSKVSSLLKILEKKGVVLIQGKGRSTKYIIK